MLDYIHSSDETLLHNAQVADVQGKVEWYSDLHPLLLPDPNPPFQADWVNFTIPNPVSHRVGRDGDWMFCRDCGDCIYAPSMRWIETNPMVLSTTGWD